MIQAHLAENPHSIDDEAALNDRFGRLVAGERTRCAG
jgi:hypothetical protein